MTTDQPAPSNTEETQRPTTTQQLVRCTMPDQELTFDDSPCTLLAWQQYVQYSTELDAENRRTLLAALPSTTVGTIQSALLRSHPSMPQLVRLHSQLQLLDLISTLPDDLASYFRWLAQQQQRLLETELTVQTLSRLNSQQQHEIQRLRTEIAEKSAQLQALTDIEARLNEQQPDLIDAPEEPLTEELPDE
ncbi:MAG: hypothetical protein JXQ97_13210 [Natronospirillum sp.]